MMAKYTVEQEHDQCISCGACVSVCPDNWEMGDDDKSHPKKTDIEEDELDCNKQAAEGCPVQIIHIKNNENGEKLI